MVQSVEARSVATCGAHEIALTPLASELRVLEPGEYLYKQEDPRLTAYKVERGVVAVFEWRVAKPARIVDMASPGEYVGLGCLAQHGDNARAVVDSVVRLVPRTDVDLLAEHDPKLRQKQDEATERDFEHRMVSAHTRDRSTPLTRVAALLVAVSRENACEGRDPTVISDLLTCVAALNRDPNTFSRALRELQHMDLVEERGANVLHLKNIEALEGIVDGDLLVNDLLAACA
jgi:CRP/FNR family transcriptional regulator, anaerobic regulatory protein